MLLKKFIISAKIGNIICIQKKINFVNQNEIHVSANHTFATYATMYRRQKKRLKRPQKSLKKSIGITLIEIANWSSSF